MKNKKSNLTKQKIKALLASENPSDALRAAGCTLGTLLAAGWTPDALRAAGWTPGALLAAGWTPGDLRAAGWTPGALLAAGCTIGTLLAAGWTTSALRAAGWTPGTLLAAGWTPGDLLAAGWTTGDLRAAGWTPGALRAAGWTPGDLRAAGWTTIALRAAEKEWKSIPKLDRPYSKLLADIEAKKRTHDQKTFGPEYDPETDLCDTPMCTAGHLVNMAGEIGYQLKAKYGWTAAARLIHMKAHPKHPAQNFSAIPQEFALAYIREMAAEEKEAA